ncbi:MAG: hypothetical protein HKN27_03395 [Silicimonas sp.]|nr:hypothetical protein [Silicimonas sp.]
MEPISLVFYAVVCGVLSLVAPKLGAMIPRFAVGAVVGAGSAAALPSIVGMMGY